MEKFTNMTKRLKEMTIEVLIGYTSRSFSSENLCMRCALDYVVMIGIVGSKLRRGRCSLPNLLIPL